MTLRIPKVLLLVLGVLLLAGGGLAVYLTLIKSDEVCYSESGAEVGCDEEGALTQAEYDEQQAEEAAAEAEAERLAAKCEGQTEKLLDEARELDARLNVGLSFTEYSDHVGDVSVAYRQITFNELNSRCTFDVGLPLENALNSYIKADNIWNDCITDFGCDTESIDPELQDHWTDASTDVSSAERGLARLARP